MDPATALATGFAVGLAGIHLVGDRFHGVDGVPRSAWLSAAGGISVAYVFVHLLPEIEAAGRTISAMGGPRIARFELHAYVLALAGFVGFYGLEGFVTGRRGETAAGEPDAVFWIHIGSFGAYNTLIGYLLVAEDRAPVNLLLFGTAMAMHFLVNDYGLREHHDDLYQTRGRWVLAASVLVGAGIGLGTRLSELLVAYLLSVLAGSIVLNVIKEELPADRESRFWPFGAGAVGYTLLLLGL